MPREITILSRKPHDLYALARAAEGIDHAAEVREIDAGDATQVVSDEGLSLLTIYAPRLLDVEGEVARLLPSAPSVEVPVWWTDAVAPWNDEGESGVSIALRLALGLEAVCVVED